MLLLGGGHPKVIEEIGPITRRSSVQIRPRLPINSRGYDKCCSPNFFIGHFLGSQETNMLLAT